ncbi:MAG: RNA polymerase factor sigma-54, partial [Candidatus Margulisbacteria bacterium]|jgi:RNA polymerase sigma-54 factor|nr:RNA polymerase factor sigma-54 [Candidatus Margulisiibacteriota bacterium]
MAEHAPKLNLAQTLNLSQQLKLMLNPRMLQLLKTLHLPYPDLLEAINKEAAENPALEISRQDELLNYARTLSRGGERPLSGYDDSRPDKELKARGPTLHEHLLQQARLENFDAADLRVAERLIDAIDERGYIEDYKTVREQIVAAGGVTKNHVEQVLGVIQTFEPDGVGARSLKECLLIQIREHNFENAALRQVISDAVKYHLDNLAKKNFTAVAEDLDIEPDGVKFIAEFIEKNLNPLPGNAFKNDDHVQTIIPSFIIKRADGGFTVLNLEADKGPRLNINNQYLQMLDNPDTDAKTKEYLRERLAAAKIFIENIEKRYQTVQNIVDIIVKTQTDFLENGYYWLKPLQQDTLAQNVGVHPSTISRAVSTKYAETPQGLYPLKYLCPRNFKGYTAMQIKGMLIKIIREQPQLSDQKIANLLHERRGIPIKRRTIAKYRTDLGEASSYGRQK